MTVTSLKNSPKVPATSADLFAYLDDLKIKYTTYNHKAVFTVAESDKVEADIPGLHCKCLFLKDAKEDRLWLVGTIGHKRVDLKALNTVLGCGRFSFASPEKLMEKLGVIPGSVTLFAVINNHAKDVEVVMDEDLMGSDLVNFHPLQNDMTTGLSPYDLQRFIESCGHKPMIVKIPAQ